MDTSPKKARILGHLETGGYESTIYIDSTTGRPRSLVAPPQGGAGGFLLLAKFFGLINKTNIFVLRDVPIFSWRYLAILNVSRGGFQFA